MRIALTIDENGKPNLEGPIDNKVLCYGLLELAKDVLNEYHRNKQKNRIEIPRIELPNGL